MLHLHDDGTATLSPLTDSRPSTELRSGMLTLGQRLARYFGVDPVASDDQPSLSETIIIANGRWLPAQAVGPEKWQSGAYFCGDDLAFLALASRALSERTLAKAWSELPAELPRFQVDGAMIRFPWDLVEHNADALRQDALHWSATREKAPVPVGVTVIGSPDQVFLDPEAKVEPNVILDTTNGPVLIDREAEVQAFSRLVGPSYVGQQTRLLAARVTHSSFGPGCRMGGEVECTIVHGHSNKAHEGFLGHSYVGEWVNLGAGTFTSDLRTDYGKVRMTVEGRQIETGLMKIGAFIGDHVKTSIGVLFNTGTVVGPFSLLLASGTLLPRVIPAFSRYGHGRLSERTDLGQMFETASIAMARRGQAWTDAHADKFLDLYEQTADQRLELLRDSQQRRLRRVV